MANNFEKIVIRAAKKAASLYDDLTGGYWLCHGPESYLQCEVANAIGRSGYWVFVDASIKKTKQDQVNRRGRIRKDSRKRFDISIWYKSKDRTLKAVIEVKRAWTLEPLAKDAKKIESAFKYKDAAKTGYILVYSTAKDRDDLDSNFKNWGKELNWKVANSFIQKPHKERVWGVALLRYR